ncbi:TIGR04282 family arsenosugar biosynthesis glycosyltransferase [Parapedobacter deserti]|uniref:TIGR04282 family arsenosugar biosynthesis glycosyltransferase n=1 Tax=Parapedobacter deserti TaxID=1912957 RepID=A0ABV7JPU2_9SPHI
MKQPNALVIFARNLVYGQVKTRLAATIGADRAYETYKQLLVHTNRVVQHCAADKLIFYSEEAVTGDLWDARFSREVQLGADLGERMQNAFAAVFQKGYVNTVLIGTDCPALSEHIVQRAFDELEGHDVVIGPADDGGYYLLGMNAPHPELFTGIAWSTERVFETTTVICDRLGLRYAILPSLPDIDEEKDLVHLKLLVV